MTREPIIHVNDRRYPLGNRPLIVVCIDGSALEYHEQAMAAGRMPYLEGLYARGTVLEADCVMPSFTNPNNVSIATGQPPAVHGICGNYFYDSDAGAEVMMNEPGFMRASTIFAAAEGAGATVAVITAKDKLRRLLAHELQSSICFSAERADAATVDEYGIDNVLEFVGKPLPQVYSADLSEFVMAAGVRVLREYRPDLMYLTLTDYIQHKHAPGTPEADDFYAMLDSYWAQLDELGATLVVTADHGMNAKSNPDGTPRVVYLQSELETLIGGDRSRVVLPITDPYTAHHGSLGSFAFVYLDGADERVVADKLAQIEGVDAVLTRAEAVERFELPADRSGDLAVVGAADTALGTTPQGHDLSQLGRPLRSHGGLAEQRVPLFVNAPVRGLATDHHLRNFDAFWVGANLT